MPSVVQGSLIPSFDGKQVTRGEGKSEKYEKARTDRIFNRRRPDKFPSNILFPTCKEDVIAAVQYAHSQNKKITIRSGGHSWAAWSLREDSVLIDMSEFKKLDVDKEARLANVSPSTTGKMLNEALGPLGLMFNGGHCPDVGVGGFLLQGGQGWSARDWGWSAQQIESMEVVTASGQLLTASRKENPDLFWAARGSGPGFFAVVLTFTLHLRPLVDLYGSVFIFDAVDHYDAVSEWYLNSCPQVPSDCEMVMLGFRSERLMPQLSPPRPLLLIRALTFTDDEIKAKEILDCFARGIPRIDQAHVAVFCERSTFAEEYQRQADDNPVGRYFVQNAWLDGPLDQVADSMKLAFTNLPTPQSFALHYSMAPLRPLPDDMCFSIQTPHTFSLYTIAPSQVDTELDLACERYHDKIWNKIDERRPDQGGSMGIYLGDSDLSKRPVRFMSKANWSRFCELRRKWDPQRTFAGYDGEKEESTWNRNPWEGEKGEGLNV